MRFRTLLTLLALCLAFGLSGTARAANVEWFEYYDKPPEPPVVSTLPSSGIFYPDGSPLSNSYPCEIYQLKAYTLMDKDTFQVTSMKFELHTNFGDTTTSGRGNTKYNGTFWDERGHFSSFSIPQCPTGDLYIQVKNRKTGATQAVYGVPLESRTDDQTSIWGHRMYDLYGVEPGTGNGSTPNNRYSVTGGLLYSGVQFATGTWERYPQWAGTNGSSDEIPPMAWAAALPNVTFLASEKTAGVPDPTIPANLYPSLMLTGTATTETVPVTWKTGPGPDGQVHQMKKADGTVVDTCDGYWQIGTEANGLQLPDGWNWRDSYVDVWWTMMCGNDGVLLSTAGSGPAGPVIPLPGSLLLCGIGVGFAALVAGVRRRLRRS